MGKVDFEKNIPTNSSLSFTLNHFVTEVQLEKSNQDSWEPLNKDGFLKPELSEKGQARFLKHLQRMKDHFGVTDHFLVKSASNFSSDCGLASSASSFAALTLACEKAFKALGFHPKDETPLNCFGRQGSGSSCRSFFSPWAIWSHEEAQSIELPFGDMDHEIIFLDAKKKEVSSGDAHKRVFTSPRFEGRPERAEQRLNDLIGALIDRNWKECYIIVRDEFKDMHELFETSNPSFTYRTPQSMQVVEFLETIWNEKGDGPLMIMDAGPNIHLLFRPDQKELKKEILASVKKRFLE